MDPTEWNGPVTNPDKIRVDPILVAAPGPDTRVEWVLLTACTDCGTVDLIVIHSWSLGDALCLLCVVHLEVAAEVYAGLDQRLAGRRYAALAARAPRACNRIAARSRSGASIGSQVGFLVARPGATWELGLTLFGTSDPDGAVYAVDAITGKLVWRVAVYKPPPGTVSIGAGVVVSPPGVNGFAGGVAYVENKDGIMYAIDLTTGAVIWTYNFGAVTRSHPPGSLATAALYGNVLKTGTAGGFDALNATTGTPLWRFSTGETRDIDASPIITGPLGDQAVSSATQAGAVDVVSLATGTLLYIYQTGSFVVSSMADANGNLIEASADGHRYDFALGGGTTAAPTTALDSPVDGSTLSNSGGAVTITGTALGTSIGRVDVAVQEGGPRAHGGTQPREPGPPTRTRTRRPWPHLVRSRRRGRSRYRSAKVAAASRCSPVGSSRPDTEGVDRTSRHHVVPERAVRRKGILHRGRFATSAPHGVEQLDRPGWDPEGERVRFRTFQTGHTDLRWGLQQDVPSQCHRHPRGRADHHRAGGQIRSADAGGHRRHVGPIDYRHIQHLQRLVPVPPHLHTTCR